MQKNNNFHIQTLNYVNKVPLFAKFTYLKDTFVDNFTKKMNTFTGVAVGYKIIKITGYLLVNYVFINQIYQLFSVSFLI